MVHTLALAGICARRNGINGMWGGLVGLCRKFLASIFRREPKFAPELMRELDCNARNDIAMASDFNDARTWAAIRQVRKIEVGFIYC